MEKWNFNNCQGAMDSKYVEIKKPSGNGATLFSNNFSNCSFAVVNADHEFTYVYTGTNGSVSGGIIITIKFPKKY